MDICPTLICVFILYAYKLKGVKCIMTKTTPNQECKCNSCVNYQTEKMGIDQFIETVCNPPKMVSMYQKHNATH